MLTILNTVAKMIQLKVQIVAGKKRYFGMLIKFAEMRM
jgi:hypothetical protein